MGILCKLSCLEQVSGFILRVHTEMLYFKPLHTLLGVYVNKLKDRGNFSLAELIWKGLVGNLALERRNLNNCLFLNSSRYIRLLVFLQLSGDKPNSQTEI